MPKLNVVGPQVKQARKEHSPPLTQDQLAIRLQTRGWNIDRFGVSKIERQARTITDKELLMLAEALGVSVGWLMGEE